MKSIIEEYGKLVIGVFLGLTMLAFAFSYGPNGFMTSLKKYQPKSSIKLDNNVETLKSYATVLQPKLTVKTKKLTGGKAYDLLSDQFVKAKVRRTLKSASADPALEENVIETEMTNSYTLKITKICDNKGKELALPADGRTCTFTGPTKNAGGIKNPVVYQVTYELADITYPDYPVAISVTYNFLVA